MDLSFVAFQSACLKRILDNEENVMHMIPTSTADRDSCGATILMSLLYSFHRQISTEATTSFYGKKTFSGT